MGFIVDVLKGMVMGIANVIPGVSGGTMAVAMGIYDKLIHALTHIFKELKKSIITVLPIGLGMVVGIVGLSMVIEWMFGVAPIQTNMLFMGLILGGVPAILRRVKSGKKNPGHYLGFIIFFALVIGLSYIQYGTEKEKAAIDQAREEQASEEQLGEDQMAEPFRVETGAKQAVLYVGAGVVSSATMVVPGVSGSMMMMVMGLYEDVVGSISNFVKAATSGDWDTVINCCGLLVPFGIGAVVGVFAIAKIIEILLKKFPYATFWCILGLVIGSPIAIIVVNLDIFKGISLISGGTGIIGLAVGFVIALFLGAEKSEG